MTIGFNEEILSGLLLPSQYNSLVRGKRYETSEAEKGLLQAVLEDAIRTYLSDRNANTGPRRVRFAETKRWFEDSVDDGARGPFAYESVCDALGIDPDLLRMRLGLNKNPHRSGGRGAGIKITRIKRDGR